MKYTIVVTVDTGDGGYLGASLIVSAIENIIKEDSQAHIEDVSIYEGTLDL